MMPSSYSRVARLPRVAACSARMPVIQARLPASARLRGEILDRKAKGPGVVIADLDHQRITEIRESLPALAHRQF